MLPEVIFKTRRAFKGGFKNIQMVGITNIVLLQPTGENPEFTDTCMIVWDDKRREIVH